MVDPFIEYSAKPSYGKYFSRDGGPKKAEAKGERNLT